MQLQGVIERITYQNTDNYYTVAKLQVNGQNYLTTVVGYLPGITVGETVNLEGKWVNHKDYGQQFQVDNYQVTVPATINGIKRYLASGMIKGIGEATAERMVACFGLQTLEVLENEPYRLTEVEGIGEKRAEKIAAAFIEQREIKEVMLFLQEHGVSPVYAVKIYKNYGAAAIPVIKENPYRLADDIFGIGFKTADKIARHFGIEPDSLYRLTAGVKYVLSQITGRGHTYVPLPLLLEEAVGMLAINDEKLSEAINCLAEEKEVFIEEKPAETRVYLAPFYYAEQGVAARLKLLLDHRYQAPVLNVDARINEIETTEEIKLDPLQKEAIHKAVDNGVLVITGGPGTGKTTTINSIIKVLEQQFTQICLAAPTGRAAKRMAESTGREAKTIHRLLEFSFVEKAGMQFLRNDREPLEASVLIIDEASMIDTILMYNLLKAVKPGTRLILVGDVDQLPSVGAGNVLHDLIASGTIEVVKLDKIFRQAQESMIVVNAHRINRGELPIINNQSRDFFFIPAEKPEEIMETIIELCERRLPKIAGPDFLNTIQVLTPMRKTMIGVENLNIALQAVLNLPDAAKSELKVSSTVFREGDKVMQIKNNYEKQVYNGDVGRVDSIDTEEEELAVVYTDVEGDRTVIYSKHECDELVLAYAVSVHKSQGSEYPVVVMPVSTQHYMMLQRNLLYTAITRAKQMVVLVGTQKAIALATRNNRVAERYSGLAERLREEDAIS